MPRTGSSPELLWDSGTAYDFFTSLYVIHSPSDFGLRASWAAGIRSRLSAGTRELFLTIMRQMEIPAPWLLRLPQPKDARTVLELIEGMKPEEILPTIAVNPPRVEKCEAIALDVLKKGHWTENDIEGYLECAKPASIHYTRKDRESIRRWLDCWARPADFGSGYARGLREFYEGFFREEEQRISADINRALANARAMAERLPPADLFEELSQGIRVDTHLAQRRLVLVPCYWCSPRILYADLGEGEQIVLFGARPPEASLIPGDAVPARLLLALEALSDPTRLSILRAVIQEPLTQADIARKLRLRPPTISHHLKSLRIAGLIAYIGKGRDETRYGARIPRILETCSGLKEFLGTA